MIPRDTELGCTSVLSPYPLLCFSLSQSGESLGLCPLIAWGDACSCGISARGEDIGDEVHDDVDQFFRIEEGSGEILINGRRLNVKSDDAILVPAGARHNVRNTRDETLRFYTLYGPPEHQDKTVHVTKRDAETSKEHFDGKTSEDAD
jgi:mannose-6-phosphate isomerase-like protein (cupin superfamily)